MSSGVSAPHRAVHATTIQRRRRKKLPSVGKVVSVVILAVGGVGMLAPFVWMVVTSLKTSAHAYDLPPTWFPTEFNFNNFAQAINGSVPFLLNMLNSGVIAIAVTLGIIITAPMAGYAFARLRFRGSGTIFVLLLTSLMVPIQVTIIPLWLIMKNLDLINTPWSLILPGITGAFGVFLMRQFFLTLPQEIFEAARIDGANAWTTYTQIALPLVKNGLSTLGVITFLASWNGYFAASIFLNSVQTATLPLGLVLMLGPYGTGQVNVIMAATTLAILPAFVVFLIAQRWIIESLTQTAVKG
jgi:multiple sugar transport system permease protein